MLRKFYLMGNNKKKLNYTVSDCFVAGIIYIIFCC